MNIGTLGILFAQIQSSSRLSILGLIVMLLLVLVVVSLSMKVMGAIFRRGGLVGVFLLLFFATMALVPLWFVASFTLHRQAYSGPVAVEQRMVQTDFFMLTFRPAEDLPPEVSGVDLALTLKQLAHDMALADTSDQESVPTNLLQSLVKRTDERTITLGDLVKVRRVTRHHPGSYDDSTIELISHRSSTLALFRETAAALKERINPSTNPTVVLEVNDRILRLRIMPEEDFASPENRWEDRFTGLDDEDYKTVKAEALEAVNEAMSEVEMNIDDVDEIISTALNGAFQGLAEVKRAKARLRKELRTKMAAAAEEKAQDRPRELSETPTGDEIIEEEANDEAADETEVADAEDESVEEETTETEIVSTKAAPAALSADAPVDVERATPSESEYATAKPLPLPGLTEQGAYQLTIHAGPHTNLTDCEAELSDKRHAALIDYAEKLLGPDATEHIDFARFEFQHPIPEHRTTETIQHPEFGPMHNIYAELTFDPRLQQQLQSEYRDSVISDRLVFTGVTSGLFLLFLSAVFGYLKLDTLTRGYYRGRLALGAGTVIAAAVAAVALLA